MFHSLIIAILKYNDTLPKRKKKKTHSNVDSVTTKWCQWPCSPPHPPFPALSSPCLLFSTTMVNHRISDDLKLAALRLKARGRDSVSKILDIVGFSKKTFYRVQGQFRHIRTVAKANAIGRGRPRKILLADTRYLVRLAHHKPTLFLDEYRSRLEWYRSLTVSMATIHRALERAGLNMKQVQKMASEQDPTRQADFIRRIAQYPANYLLPIDEVSKDDRTYARLWGRSEVDQGLKSIGPSARSGVSQCLLHLRWMRELLQWMLSKGHSHKIFSSNFCGTMWFAFILFSYLSWFFFVHVCSAFSQLPLTTPHPGPQSVILIDNAWIHHHPDIIELMESYGM